jgi:hypothetical protein
MKTKNNFKKQTNKQTNTMQAYSHSNYKQETMSHAQMPVFSTGIEFLNDEKPELSTFQKGKEKFLIFLGKYKWAIGFAVILVFKILIKLRVAVALWNAFDN